MDLILLQPGDTRIFADLLKDRDGPPAIDNAWRDTGLDLGACIELVSVHQGMKQQITTDVSNSARTSGRPIVSEFTCVKYVDQSSVKFYEYCLRAQPLGTGPQQPTLLYILRNSGGATANIMSFALRDAIISEIQLQSHPDDMPTEQFKLNFTEILWTYTVQSPADEPGGKLSAGWSLARNRPITGFS
jgi:type VI secretion system secreted protein Hcp